MDNSVQVLDLRYDWPTNSLELIFSWCLLFSLWGLLKLVDMTSELNLSSLLVYKVLLASSIWHDFTDIDRGERNHFNFHFVKKDAHHRMLLLIRYSHSMLQRIYLHLRSTRVSANNLPFDIWSKSVSGSVYGALKWIVSSWIDHDLAKWWKWSYSNSLKNDRLSPWFLCDNRSDHIFNIG